MVKDEPEHSPTIISVSLGILHMDVPHEIGALRRFKGRVHVVVSMCQKVTVFMEAVIVAQTLYRKLHHKRMVFETGVKQPLIGPHIRIYFRIQLDHMLNCLHGQRLLELRTALLLKILSDCLHEFWRLTRKES